MIRKFRKGAKEIYERVFDGLSYYQTPGEVYHDYRKKQKVQAYYLEATARIVTPRILDIGCNIGTDLFMLPKPNPKARYWGIDVSEDAIHSAQNFARQRGEKNITFQAIDANRPFPFPKHYFDLIYSLELIEHLHDPSKFLMEVSQILKPNGTLIITTPNTGRLTERLPSLLPLSLQKNLSQGREQDFSRHGPSFHLDSQVWDNQAHISLHGYNEWKQIFSAAGYTIEAVDGSSILGGSRAIGDHPFLLGLAILADSLIDKIPLKPHLQMCLIVTLKKLS